jgi:hypothetical protein
MLDTNATTLILQIHFAYLCCFIPLLNPEVSVQVLLQK